MLLDPTLTRPKPDLNPNRQVHQALVNISFSTAGLPRLPDMSRLPYLESVAASFNFFGGEPLLSIASLASLPSALRTLNLSHCRLQARRPPSCSCWLALCDLTFCSPILDPLLRKGLQLLLCSCPRLLNSSSPQELPSDMGSSLPNLTELNVSSNAIQVSSI